MLERARAAGVEKIICVGTSHADSLKASDFAAHQTGVYWTYGIHPENIATPVPENTWGQNAPIAIGEVGLDYHYDEFNREAQIKLFESMLQLATDHDLPVSFHVREAFPDFFAVIKNFPKVRGVVHSFTDSKKTLKRILNETDFYVGINGLATYSTLPTPPIERTLLETDAPFLAPRPFRGKINEPSYIPEIAAWLSEKINLDVKDVAKITTKNAETLFQI